MKKNMKHFRKGIALMLALSLLATGCSKSSKTGEKPVGQESGQESASVEAEKGTVSADAPAGTTVSQDDLVVALKAKYGAGVVDYSGDTITISRDESIQIKLGYDDPWGPEGTDIPKNFVVYQDPNLKHPLEIGSYDWNEESGMLTIEPPVFGPAEVDSVGMVDLSHLSGSFLSTDGEYGWGNLPQLYLAVYVDVETGEPVQDNPLVTVVKVKAELAQTPQVKFSQDSNGAARFTWKEVPGAEEYLIFSINNYDGELDTYMDVLSSTTGTEWVAQQNMSIDGTEALRMNEIFMDYLASDDDRGEVDEAYLAKPDYDKYFGVIAVNGSGSSHISNLFKGSELAHMLPGSIAYNTNDETIGATLNGTGDLPSTMGIIMCDGTVSQRVIEYDVDSIEKNTDNPYYFIRGKAYGTPFVKDFHVMEPDWDTLDEDLKAIVERQEKLKNKGGNMEADISILNQEDSGEEAEPIMTEEPSVTEEPTMTEEPSATEEPIMTEEPSATEEPIMTEEPSATEEPIMTEEPSATEEPIMTEEPSATEEPQKGQTGEDGTQAIDISTEYGRITANSALSEYLAIQMLNTEPAIDVSAFPEAADTALVVDAFLEAQYQNPLILGIKEVRMDTVNSILYINYDYDAQTTAAKRQEIQEKVENIIREIIRDDMSDLDKELAINQYLCDNGEYDQEALKNAEKNDFQYVDERYNDSFTAYGILVKGVGVCASYSAGFKLLADAAGLDSIVVTGYLEGNLPHAWNKVSLDGQWNIVDSTNNDNEIIKNALFNLSDDGAYAALVEDERFALDGNLYDYKALSDDKEYYRITDNYFGLDEISHELASRLKTDGSAVVRTDYNLDDQSFNTIAQEAADAAQTNISGFYWMGVIRLEQR